MRRKIAGRGAVVALAVLVCTALAVPVFAYSDVHDKNIVLQHGKKGTATASCPAGQHAVLGGISAPFSVPDFGAGAAIFPQAMFMDATQTKWNAVGVNGALHGSATLGSHVYCSVHAARIAVSKTASVGEGSSGRATATCPAGKVVQSAGFKTPAGLQDPGEGNGPPAAFVTRLRATTTTVIARIAVHGGAGPRTVTAIAYCGPGPAPTEKSAQIHLNNSTNHLQPVTATCPSGKHLGFGGFDATFAVSGLGAEVAPFSMSSPSTTKWTVNGYNPTPTQGTLTAYAYCR